MASLSRSVDHTQSRYSVSQQPPSEEHQRMLIAKQRLEGLTNDEIKIKNRVALLENEQ